MHRYNNNCKCTETLPRECLLSQWYCYQCPWGVGVVSEDGGGVIVTWLTLWQVGVVWKTEGTNEVPAGTSWVFVVFKINWGIICAIVCNTATSNCYLKAQELLLYGNFKNFIFLDCYQMLIKHFNYYSLTTTTSY